MANFMQLWRLEHPDYIPVVECGKPEETWKAKELKLIQLHRFQGVDFVKVFETDQEVDMWLEKGFIPRTEKTVGVYWQRFVMPTDGDLLVSTYSSEELARKAQKQLSKLYPDRIYSYQVIGEPL